MITESMRLDSKTDARQWASEFGLFTDEQEERLAAWIWENKNRIGEYVWEHPVSDLSDEEFWDAIEG